ncbi:L-aspartate oxidase [Rhodococcus sp. WMMA185]|uniref:oxygenase MpaB family protein n=1 Tax=Rhodococcus sp. WMMA185 TaxID=679318 RepID=UPI00087901F3|nr:oxygenase MpaB family protein [Rhodococcus sp. WMMA185]AOW95179.1 L-aspartate oxidase [Rhodococcus sp. WMMA185]
MKRFDLRNRTDQLDPETQYEEICRVLGTQEFPWDITQALSFALFRTYAVPTIGNLLYQTGEFTERVQKRYDDTALILDAVLEDGIHSDRGRAAIRRMNQMHGSYDISNDDMRYVLSTFVVTPVRWIDDFGWRKLTRNEIVASTNYYRALGSRMGIKQIPETFEAFEKFLDDYEREHFLFDEGSRAVADSTLDLLCTFPPNNLAPAALIKRFSMAIMDDHLLDAFGYPRPSPLFRRLARGALKARARLIRFYPVRTVPKFARDLSSIRSYPHGYEVEKLGTFPTTCPVRRTTETNSGDRHTDSGPENHLPT